MNKIRCRRLKELLVSNQTFDFSARDVSIIKNKHVLLTGASGLIGVNFLASIKHLTEKHVPIKVTLVLHDNPTDYLLDLINETKAEVIIEDLSEIDNVLSLPKADFIIHTAGYAQPTRFMTVPLETFNINCLATSILLNKLNTHGRFLFLSSSEVYCGLRKSLYKETDIGNSSPLHPRAAYIEGKRGGEALCNYYNEKKARAFAVRLGDIYGPGTKINDQRAIPSFIEKGILLHKIEMLDSGSAVRTYCYVSDAIEWLWKILLYGSSTIYNLSSPKSYTIVEVARQIAKLTNSSLVIPKTNKSVRGAPRFIKLNLSKIKKEFPKKKFISLEEGLKRTIAWHEKLISH